MLVCSATGGYPPITNISLLKNGDVIASAASDAILQVNTADLPPNIYRYGLYVCLVDLSGLPLQQSVVLKKRGNQCSTCIHLFLGLFVFLITLCVLCYHCALNTSGRLQIQLDMNSGSCTMWTVSVALGTASSVKLHTSIFCLYISIPVLTNHKSQDGFVDRKIDR